MSEKNIKEDESLVTPPILGEFANWAGVNKSEMQTIIDFGFVEPSVDGTSKKGMLFRRLILPPKVAKELGKILLKDEKDKSKK